MVLVQGARRGRDSMEYKALHGVETANLEQTLNKYAAEGYSVLSVIRVKTGVFTVVLQREKKN
jgi:hypothetical protein